MLKTQTVLLWRQRQSWLAILGFQTMAWFFASFLSASAQPSLYLWLLILFSSALTTQTTFIDDDQDGTLKLILKEQGRLDAYLLSIFFKLLGVNVILLIGSLGVKALFFADMSLEETALAMMILPALLATTLLAQSLTLTTLGQSFLAPLITWPLVLPLFLCAGAGWEQSGILGLLAVTLLLCPISFWGARFILLKG